MLPSCGVTRRTSPLRFKPLQNGAVLCCILAAAAVALILRFQTPSERGGIVLPRRWYLVAYKEHSFKPLQNGAVLC